MTRTLRLLLIPLAAVAAVVWLAGSAGAAGSTKKIVIYSAPLQEAFVANADDQIRGAVNNPYGIHSGKPQLDEKNDGPFAGDEALFSFDVYSHPDLSGKLGTATFTCQYYFDKNAFCDVSFQLKQGTLIGAGTLKSTANAFELVVTGGYGGYAGERGDVEASQSGKHAQKIAFTIN
jgi:hypothetical protein